MNYYMCYDMGNKIYLFGIETTDYAAIQQISAYSKEHPLTLYMIYELADKKVNLNGDTIHTPIYLFYAGQRFEAVKA